MSSESELTLLAAAQALLNASLIETRSKLKKIAPWTVEDILWSKDDNWSRVARDEWEGAEGELNEVYETLESLAQARVLTEGFDEYCDQCLRRLAFTGLFSNRHPDHELERTFSVEDAIRALEEGHGAFLELCAANSSPPNHMQESLETYCAQAWRYAAAGSLAYDGAAAHVQSSATQATRTTKPDRRTRLDRLKAFREKNKCHEADVWRSAKVQRTDGTKWKKDQLPAKSEMSQRIEKVLSGELPLKIDGRD